MKITSAKKIFFSVLAAVLAGFPAMAGPYLTIEKVEAETEFPKIGIYCSLKESDKTPLAHIDEDSLQVYEDGFKADYIKVQRLKEKIDFLFLIFSIDSSKSLQKKSLLKIKASAKEILSLTGPEDKIAVYRFNDDVTKLNNFTSNKRDLINSINGIERHGTKTMLFNAIYDSIDLLGGVRGSRKAIMVFTDGKDEGSSVSGDDIIKFSRDSGIPVNFATLKGSRDIRTMSRIAKMTGGKCVFIEQPGSLSDLYQRIVSAKENRYLVKYQSRIRPDGGKHGVEIRLKSGEVRDRDSAEFVLKKFSFDFISAENAIFLGVIAFLTIVIAVSFIFYAKKDKKAASPGEERKVAKTEKKKSMENLMDLEEKERIEEDTVLSSHDPKFLYAKAWLMEKEGPATGNKYPLYWDEITMGRGKDNSVIMNDESVSLRHAKIKNVRNAYYLFDLVSDNGTFLNDKKLIRPKILYDWDEIKLGRTKFIFRGSNSPLQL